ncbi:MAG: ABC transporter substrate-binding protein, partial [Bosea sp. (in: a-proteobacteria)]
MRFPAQVFLALALTLAGASLMPQPAMATGIGPTEPPILAEAVKAGKLPPMAERLPRTPRVIDIKAMGRENGTPGGELRMLMADQRDL